MLRVLDNPLDCRNSFLSIVISELDLSAVASSLVQGYFSDLSSPTPSLYPTVTTGYPTVADWLPEGGEVLVHNSVCACHIVIVMVRRLPSACLSRLLFWSHLCGLC